ncbi:MAG: DUF896 domain-containing protein [Syntrophomonadaceae bacterium]|nr:DUF896 domain-containing protein [Syntrophomonadaceae bacterium]MDD3888749.1 DUF896 domain-containing protein [Syntrophomonadaceae bacterium]MDD4548174.1 DUF896 domain-containing protein [Syntrophomonadaceae bacterium]
MKQEQLDRINELASKKKSTGLTADETEEQKQLYRLFIDEIKGQVKTQLDQAGYNSKPQS